MRFVLGASLALLLTAGSAGAQSRVPLKAMIVEMAQHFVQETFMFNALGNHHIEFDVAHLHPQSEANYWAVVGGFISDQNTPNTYVAAVRLICKDHEQVKCWELDKLAINRTILIDKGKRL